MNPKKKNAVQILIATAVLSIFFPSCERSREEPDQVSSTSRFEQISDAELNRVDSQGNTLLHQAVKERDTPLIEYLLNKGLDVHAKTADLDTPLHLAVFNNDIPSAEILFFNGAHSDILEKNKEKITPFEYAVRNRYYALAELLYFPMHYLIKRDKRAYYDYLVRNKVDAAYQADMRKMTPLHVAYLFQNRGFIDRLLESGADSESVDVYGRKPAEYATLDYMEPAEENWLDNGTRIRMDDKVLDFLMHYNWMTVGIIQDGTIAYLRSYGKRNMLEKDAVYASVSKPVTSVVFVQLLRQGLVRSLDDSIFDYSKKYNKDVLPEQYSGSNITFKHLLTHQSGIPHIDKPLWKDSKLNLQFQPGTETAYSTNGFGVLGEVMEEITGKSYSDLVKDYIGNPVRASSFWAEDTFRAPGARVHSTPEDFARFARGVIDHSYMSEQEFSEILAKNYGESALGWGGSQWDSDDLAMGHAGSNGKPRAYILIKPRKKLGVVLMGEANSSKEDIWFLHLGPILMDVVDRQKSR